MLKFGRQFLSVSELCLRNHFAPVKVMLGLIFWPQNHYSMVLPHCWSPNLAKFNWNSWPMTTTSPWGATRWDSKSAVC